MPRRTVKRATINPRSVRFLDPAAAIVGTRRRVDLRAVLADLWRHARRLSPRVGGEPILTVNRTRRKVVTAAYAAQGRTGQVDRIHATIRPGDRVAYVVAVMTHEVAHALSLVPERVGAGNRHHDEAFEDAYRDLVRSRWRASLAVPAGRRQWWSLADEDLAATLAARMPARMAQRCGDIRRCN